MRTKLDYTTACEMADDELRRLVEPALTFFESYDLRAIAKAAMHYANAPKGSPNEQVALAEIAIEHEALQQDYRDERARAIQREHAEGSDYDTHKERDL